MRRDHIKTFAVFVLVFVITCLYILQNYETKTTSSSRPNSVEIVEDEYPPCGEICQYTNFSTASENVLFTNIRKDVNCKNIMKRMAYTKHNIQYPPPRQPPEDLYGDFTQNGKCPITKTRYLISFSPGNKSVNRKYSNEFINQYIQLYKKNKNTNTYNDKGCVMKAIKEYRSYIKGKIGVVVGTLMPWLESMLLGEGIKHVTTLEYGKLKLGYPDIEVHTPFSYANAFMLNSARLFDIGVSYSSIEHSGLGRYSDPVNPYGDMEAMAQAWCFTKPGGIFILGVPYMRKGKHCKIEWNAHRIYGPERLQHLSANWNLLDYKQCFDNSHHILVILQKPLG